MIELEHIVKQWPGTRAVDDVSFAIEKGCFTVLLGPSGCGKSTVLRMIAGLEEVTSGILFINGQDVTGVDAAKRGVSMVFQSYALFPHLNVRENILFGLKVKKVPRKERETRLKDAADMVSLTPYLDRKPAQLSGGQRQRVALARTIVSRQPICLMDEPLSNLDAQLRAQMRDEIRVLQQQLSLTVLFVTHDQTEAMTMADNIILMRDGRVEQIGTPQALYSAPATSFAARFIGTPPMNILPMTALPGQHLTNAENSPDKGQFIGIRPENVVLAPPGQPGLAMQVAKLDYLGSETLAHLKADEHRIIARLNGGPKVSLDDHVTATWAKEHQHLFER